MHRNSTKSILAIILHHCMVYGKRIIKRIILSGSYLRSTHNISKTAHINIFELSVEFQCLFVCTEGQCRQRNQDPDTLSIVCSVSVVIDNKFAYQEDISIYQTHVLTLITILIINIFTQPWRTIKNFLSVIDACSIDLYAVRTYHKALKDVTKS